VHLILLFARADTFGGITSVRLPAKVTAHGKFLPSGSTNSCTSCYFSAQEERLAGSQVYDCRRKWLLMANFYHPVAQIRAPHVTFCAGWYVWRDHERTVAGESDCPLAFKIAVFP